jgi:hypothetical protein
MTRDEALKKIKKCLALAKSGNTHEAAAALRQAQKLMTAHSVTDHDMTMIDVHEASVKAVSTAANVWELRLVALVADAFGCETYANLSGRFLPSGNCTRTRTYVFVGTDAAPTVASYAYEVLSRQCAKARLAHIRKQPNTCKPITKTARGDEFAKGWVYGVRELVERFATGDRDRPLLLAYMQAKHPELTTGSARDTSKALRKNDLGHIYAGIDAAKRAQLSHGVGGIAQRELLT